MGSVMGRFNVSQIVLGKAKTTMCEEKDEPKRRVGPLTNLASYHSAKPALHLLETIPCRCMLRLSAWLLIVCPIGRWSERCRYRVVLLLTVAPPALHESPSALQAGLGKPKG